MPSDLTALSGVRGWLTESVLAYLCQVEADATEPPHYYPARLLEQDDVMNALWRRLHVRSQPDESSMLAGRRRPVAADEEDRGYQPLHPGEVGHARADAVVTPDEETATRYARAVITGEPGAGKTWLLRRIARQMTRDAFEAIAVARTATVHDPALRWPIRVRLSELAASPGEPLETLLAQEVCEAAKLGRPRLHTRRQSGGAADAAAVTRPASASGLSPRLHAFAVDAIATGRAVVLLDAWDEVPPDRRPNLQRRLHTLAQRYPAARLLVTTRDGGGLDAATLRPRAEHREKPAELELLALDPPQIKEFCDAWFREFPGPRQPAARLREVFRQHPPMAALARNPLMLTFMARLAEVSDEIPTRRVQLYDRVLRGLLSVWPREGGRDPERAPQIVPGAELDSHLRLLAAVSHRLVDAGRLNEVSESDLCAVVERSRKELAGLHHSVGRCDAAMLLEQWKADGLLVPIGDGEVLFLHRTFQEFLTGMALVPPLLTETGGSWADRNAAVAACVAAIAERLAGEDAARAVWEEPIRLGLGYLGVVKGQAAACEAVVRGVVERASDPPGRAVAAMGEVVAEISSDPRDPGRAAGREGVTPDFRTAVVQTVRACMRDERDAPAGVPVLALPTAPVLVRERVACGNALARLGDPRFHGPELWCLPDDHGTEDHLGFVQIESGDFVMGEDKKHDPEAGGNEAPRHTVPLDYEYWIARWPVTVAQFRLFVERRVQQIGTRRFELGDSRALDGPANHPVVRVSWREAVQYCDWLSEALRASGQTPAWLRSLLCTRQGDGYAWGIRLPSEAEWERAARGREGRRYPWGDEAPTGERANYRDTKVGTTSAVGCFPAGATPGDGVEELAGNVDEWTRSLMRDYPYQAGDGPEDGASAGSRVVRGGNFYFNPGGLRAARRLDADPDYRNDNFGFRVVVSPFRSGP